MELDIFWTEFAEDELFKIFSYYNYEAGYNVAKKLTDGIFGEPDKLRKQPEIGQIEEFLKDREQVFRYLIYKSNFKIIYWINTEKNHIEIVDVFDVRQNPPKIKRTQEQ